jgi:two-component system phosphate regulon response regulator OmpR
MVETPDELSGIKVAIVEDNAPLRESLALFLRVKGYRVEAFGRSEDVGDARMLSEFGIVISAFLLPGEDGLSLLRRVREASKTVITVLVTAPGNRDFPEETRRAGIDAYIAKPFTTEELEDVLLRLTGKGRGGGQAVLEAVT